MFGGHDGYDGEVIALFLDGLCSATRLCTVIIGLEWMGRSRRRWCKLAPELNLKLEARELKVEAKARRAERKTSRWKNKRAATLAVLTANSRDRKSVV